MARNVTYAAGGNRPAVLTAVTLYTSPANGNGTRTISMVATNSGGTTETFSVHIVPNGDSADDTNILVKDRSLLTLGTDLVPEMPNNLVPAGAAVQVLVSTVSTITFHGSGIEF